MILNAGSLSILVVEDTVPMYKLIVGILHSMGIKKITVCDDGKKGFEKFCRENNDIVLTDWQMDGHDGLELTRNIRKSAQSPNRMAPVIMLTGYSALPRVQTARDAGVTEFIVKPFTAHDMIRRIAHVVNNPRDFVESQDFFGPDRRRRTHVHTFVGPYRRADDKVSADALEIDLQ